MASSGDPGTQHDVGVRPSVEGDTAVLVIHGEIDVASAPRVREELNRVIDGGARRIVFDVGAVDFIDSSGLAVLVTALRRAESVTLRNPSHAVSRVVEISGLSDTIPTE